jgi:hypothetical protein
MKPTPMPAVRAMSGVSPSQQPTSHSTSVSDADHGKTHQVFDDDQCPEQAYRGNVALDLSMPAIMYGPAEQAYHRNTVLRDQIENNRAHSERRHLRPSRDR